MTGPAPAARSPGAVPGAAEIAAGVRSGRLHAGEVLEEHLARIEAAEADVHAFNLVTSDGARSAAAQVDTAVAEGRDPGPLAGVPIALKDNLCTRGVATTCSSRILEGWLPPYDATVVQRAGRSRGGRRRQDQPRRVRHGFVDRELGVRPHPQPARTRSGPGRFLGRQRRRGGRRFRVVGARIRHRGIHPPAGGPVRGGRESSPPTAWCRATGWSAFASSLDQIGPLSRSVADAALLLDVISGHDRADSTSLPRPRPRRRRASARG